MPPPAWAELPLMVEPVTVRVPLVVDAAACRLGCRLWWSR